MNMPNVHLWSKRVGIVVGLMLGGAGLLEAGHFYLPQYLAAAKPVKAASADPTVAHCAQALEAIKQLREDVPKLCSKTASVTKK